MAEQMNEYRWERFENLENEKGFRSMHDTLRRSSDRTFSLHPPSLPPRLTRVVRRVQAMSCVCRIDSEMRTRILGGEGEDV